MTKAVKLSITLPEDLVQEVRSLTDENTSLSSVIRDLLLQALTGSEKEDISESGGIPVMDRVTSLETDYTTFKEQVVNDLKEIKLSLLSQKVKGEGPRGSRTKRSANGYIALEGEVLEQVLHQIDLMNAAGLTNGQITDIMGLKGDTTVSHIRYDRRKSLSKDAFDALMAWTP